MSAISFATRARIALGFAVLSIAATGFAHASTAHAPVFSGSPPASTIVVGKSYSFTPKATDSDGSKLTFSIQNKPSWIAFDSSTGTMAGTPSVKGTTSGIVISVTDGTFTKSLPAFNLTVKEGAVTQAAPVVKGNAEISWNAPTEDENGDALGDLAGYRVAYGTSPDKLTQTVEVPSASIKSVSIEDLSKGTYYFAVKAYTKSGAESALSQIVYKQII